MSKIKNENYVEINLENFESVYNYLLSDKEFDFEKELFSVIEKVTDKVKYYIEIRKVSPLLNDTLLISNNNQWINDRYLILVNHLTTMNIITPNIIKYYS